MAIGTSQLVDIWKRNAKIEPYEGTYVLSHYIVITSCGLYQLPCVLALCSIPH